MALQINNNVKFNGGITLSPVYLRLDITLKQDGTSMIIKSSFYQNKLSYKENMYKSILYPTDFSDTISVSYDSLVNINAIKYAHDEYIKYLTTDKIGKKGLFNEDGSPVTNNDGTYALVDYVEREKFYNTNEILTLDLD
jgi:hypothetical protein